ASSSPMWAAFLQEAPTVRPRGRSWPCSRALRRARSSRPQGCRRLSLLRDRAGFAHQAYALIEPLRIGVKGRTGQRRIAVDVGPALFLDGFAHARERLRGVARIPAWSVDQVLVPIPPRQADFHGQALLGLSREFNQLRLCRLRLPFGFGGERGVIGLGAP